MKKVALLVAVLLATGCRPRPHAEAPDAGARKVTMKLGGRLDEITGDAWPKLSGTSERSAMHQLLGPLELTVVFPSGHSYTTRAVSAIGRTDETKTRLHDLELRLIKTTTWDAMVDAMEAPLTGVGVGERYRTRELAKLRSGRTEYPAFPVEGCIVATASTIERNPGYELYFKIGIATVSTWHVFDDWPDTCSVDAGADP